MAKESHSETSVSVVVSQEYVSAIELSTVLGVSIKWITNNTNNIKGRVKIGRLVRYDLQLIRSLLSLGQSIVKSDNTPHRPVRRPYKRSILKASGSGSSRYGHGKDVR